MDVNEYMKRSVELLERIAEGVESLVSHGMDVRPIIDLGEGAVIPSIETKVIPAPEEKVIPKPEKKVVASPKQEEKQPAAAADFDAAVDKAADAKQATEEKKAKPLTVDDARKALKAFASVEGNDAAMALLRSLGASSISALAEGDDGQQKLAELVKKCGA